MFFYIWYVFLLLLFLRVYLVTDIEQFDYDIYWLV